MTLRSKSKKGLAALASAVGLDDMVANLDFKKHMSDYRAKLAKAEKKARKKGGFLSFLRTAVFYVAAFFTAGMSTLASAGISAASSAAAGMIGDKMIGGIKKPKAPEEKHYKFKQIQRSERHQDLEGAYDELAAGIDQWEADINQAHYTEPLTHALAFHGPKLIKEGFGGIGLPGGENIKWDYTPTTPTTPGPPPTSYTSAGGGGSSMVTSTGTGAGAGGATTAAGSTTLARNVTSQGTDIASGEVIDWAAIDDVLNLTQPDVINMNEPSITSHIADNASAYTSSSDYFNYLDEITDDLI